MIISQAYVDCWLCVCYDFSFIYTLGRFFHISKLNDWHSLGSRTPSLGSARNQGLQYWESVSLGMKANEQGTWPSLVIRKLCFCSWRNFTFSKWNCPEWENTTQAKIRHSYSHSHTQVVLMTSNNHCISSTDTSVNYILINMNISANDSTDFKKWNVNKQKKHI